MNLTSFVKRLFTVAPDASNPSAQVVHPPSGMPIGRATHHMDLTPSATPSILESPYAFLSYSHKNMQLVHQFAAYLSQEEIPPWVDNRLEYGESWEKMIFRRIESCKVFLVLTSSAARESDFVNREIDAALRLNKLIIPICLDDESFPELQTYQSVRLLDTDHPRSRFIERLRDLLTPGQVPSRQLQRRRVEHFVLPVFEEAFEVHQEVRVTLGVGFDRILCGPAAAISHGPIRRNELDRDLHNNKGAIASTRSALPSRHGFRCSVPDRSSVHRLPDGYAHVGRNTEALARYPFVSIKMAAPRSRMAEVARQEATSLKMTAPDQNPPIGVL